MNSILALWALLCMGVIVIAFVAIGAFLLYRGFRNRSQGAAMQEWPATTGVIRESTVREIAGEGDEGWDHVPYIRYEYEVNGRPYVGSSLAAGLMNTGAGEEAARQFVRDYPVGSTVTVWYNPRDPRQSAIEKRVGASGASIVIGSVLLILSVGMVCLFFALAIAWLITIAVA